MNNNMNNLCRACLSTDTGIDFINMGLKFREYYNLLTNITVSTEDGMPQKSCQECWDTIKNFISFREKCVKSESFLRESILVGSDKINITIIPKEELTDVDEVDNKYVIKLEDIKDEVENADILNDCISDGNYEDTSNHLTEWLDNISKNKVTKRRPTRRKKPSAVEKKSIAFKDSKKIGEPKGSEIPCGLCPEMLKDNKLLLIHLENHKSDIYCQYCFESFLDLPHIIAHRLCHVPMNKQRCLICNKIFRRDIYLEYHMRTLHTGEEFVGLRCNFCLKLYQTPLQLKKHINQSHRGKKFICNMCSKVFKSKTSLKSHLLTHSDKKLYVCDTCGYSCRFSGTLQDHRIRKHSLIKLECKNCTRLFDKQHLYDRHKLKCSPSHICAICGIRVKSSNALNRHQVTHTGERRYACKRCPARYCSSNALKEHNDRHDGNKTKKCEFCNAKFYSASVLVKHRRIHTGEKPYVCKTCGRAFTGKNNLKVHMKVHGEMLIKKRNVDVDITIT